MDVDDYRLALRPPDGEDGVIVVGLIGEDAQWTRLTDLLMTGGYVVLEFAHAERMGRLSA